MTPPGATPSTFEDEPTLVLAAGTARVEVALLGATPLSWFLDLGDGRVDILDGYRTADELRAQDGLRNGIMAPFCDRVADGRYRFEGVDHDLLPGQASRLTYHGLVRSMPFEVGQVRVDGDGVTVTFTCVGLSAVPQAGYPFPVDVRVTYRLSAHALDLEIEGHNRGLTDAPFAAGWHPYVRLPGTTADDLHLHVASDVRIETDADLIPHPGTDAYARVGTEAARWTPIGDAVLDVGFVAVPGAPTVLRDPRSGVEVALTQERGLVHVFTGDTLTRDRRASIAVEPVESMTDAFNRSDCAAAIRLGPGERRTFRARMAVSRTSPVSAGS